MFLQYGELGLAAEISSVAWGTLVNFNGRVSRLGSVTARRSSSRRQPNFAPLNRGRHLYSTGRPSRWALAHILVVNAWTEFNKQKLLGTFGASPLTLRYEFCDCIPYREALLEPLCLCGLHLWPTCRGFTLTRILKARSVTGQSWLEAYAYTV